MIDVYTRLLEQVALTEDSATKDIAVQKLIAHLKSAGRMNMLPKIVRELRTIAARRATLQPVVEVSHEKESAAALRAAATRGLSAREAKINPTLIHGWRARGDGLLVDHSAKRAFVQIYQNITA